MAKKKKTALIVIAAAALIAVAAGITTGVILQKGPYSGTVTDIETGAPLSGVCVTDGRNVVKTDDNGKFTLKGYRKTRFITVTTPSGYTTEDYYIPAEKASEGYDFKLEPSEATAAESHSFVQVSDTEIGENGVGEWIEHVKSVAEKSNAAFLIHTGDICYEAGLKRHKTDMNKDNMGLPVRYVIGNHDYVEGKYGEELFESIYGPVWYSFNAGNVHYVVTPFQSGADYRSGYNKNDRWRWLENDLANTDPDMKVVMFNHTTPDNEDYVIEFDRKSLDLKKHNLAAWIYGHYHYNYVSENNGVVNISTSTPGCGGIDSSVSGTRVISIDNHGAVTTQMHYYNMPENVQEPENSIWSSALGSNILFTDTIKQNGRIFTATADDDFPHNCGIFCLDEETGKILWTVTTKNSVKNNMIYSDGKIIAQDCDGNVYCLDAEKGTKIWETKAELKRSLGTATGICADEKTVYTGSACDVTAINIADGKKVWSYHRNSGENSAAEFVLAGDKLIISPHWDALAAIDKNTGKLIWENKENGIRFRSSTPIALDDKTLLVADDISVFIINADTGEMSSFTSFEGYDFDSSAQPAADGSTAYIPTSTNGLIAFDIENKKIKWEMKPQKAMVYTAPYSGGDAPLIESTPVLKDGQITFGASDGYLYQLNAADGEIISKAFVGAPVLGKSVVCGDNTIITADFAGRVSKVALK